MHRTDVCCGSRDAVKLLLLCGADVGTVNTRSTTPLTAACLHKRADMAALLIEAGADVNAVDS
jgi:ankyrin repeat protein